MSLVVFPFRNVDEAIIGANLETAARHPSVDEVWAVAAGEGPMMTAVARGADEIAAAESKPIKVFAQERIGTLRQGKGDGMNTAIRLAAEAGINRLHFYDADITNLDATWIDGAERAANRGFGIVRHSFPRSSTDAMITWMVTRPGLAMLFPATLLPRLIQPLGGELLLTAPAIESLAADDVVSARSDWGIDTMITHATSVMGLSIYEHNVADGKRHALYGSLDEIRAMVIECLDAVARLKGRPAPGSDTLFESDPPTPVPEDLKTVVAYDIESTTALLGDGWTEQEASLADALPGDLGDRLLANQTRPNYAFMDAAHWETALRHLLERFVLGDPAWESLAFRLWLTRVLAYTTGPARAGYDPAIEYLEGTIRDYEVNADKDVAR